MHVLHCSKKVNQNQIRWGSARSRSCAGCLRTSENGVASLPRDAERGGTSGSTRGEWRDARFSGAACSRDSSAGTTDETRLHGEHCDRPRKHEGSLGCVRFAVRRTRAQRRRRRGCVRKRWRWRAPNCGGDSFGRRARPRLKIGPGGWRPFFDSGPKGQNIVLLLLTLHSSCRAAMATARAWLRSPIHAARPLPRLPGDELKLEPGSAKGVPPSKRRRDDDIGAYREPFAKPNSNPFTIAAGKATPLRETELWVNTGSHRLTTRSNPPRIPPGDYVLPDNKSFLRYEPGLFSDTCTSVVYDELWDLSRSVPPTPNPMNRSTNLRRKQGTFGSAYKFGAQASARVDGPSGLFPEKFKGEKEWPALVNMCVADARARISERHASAFEAEGRLAAHVNWYPDGTAGMGRHCDCEASLVDGAPIFSYSFYSKGANSPPRLFDLYEKKNIKATQAQKPFAAVPLAHGDLCIMAGEFQHSYEHGVRVTAAKAHLGNSRINITVRAFNEPDHV